MQHLIDAIDLLDASILKMANLKTLPHELLRSEKDFSIIKTQKTLKQYPELEETYQQIDELKRTTIAIFSNNENACLAYQFATRAINDTQKAIADAQDVHHQTEVELQAINTQHTEAVTNHIITLFKNAEVEPDKIDFTAIKRASLQQQMQNIKNAITLLNYKKSVYIAALQAIELKAAKDYYKELSIAFNEKLNVFKNDFEKLKAAAVVAMPELKQHETMTLNYGRDKNPKYFDERQIDKKITEIIENIAHFPTDDYLHNLHPTIREALMSDNTSDTLFNVIDQNYQAKLTN